MKVRAISLGYQDNRRRYPGDVFVLTPITKRDGTIITPEQQFSKRWMEKVDKSTPEINTPKVPISAATLGEHEEQRNVPHPGVDASPEPEETTEKAPETKAEEATPEETVEKPKEEEKASTGDSDVI